MLRQNEIYVGGGWISSASTGEIQVINPADEQPIAVIPSGSGADVDKAVGAARAAFESFGQTSKEERVELLERLADKYGNRKREMALAISSEMGAPMTLAVEAQAEAGVEQLQAAINALKSFEFEETLSDDPSHVVAYEPIGVAGLITPWNWPMSQVAQKTGAALAAGCTVVLKPSEVSPLSALLFAEFVHEAGLPGGVFNLVNGEGAIVGDALARHPDVDVISFTGSTRTGVAVSKAAAETVKRVALELGGKSPNVVFADSDIEQSVRQGVLACFENSGQSCNAPSRMLVERSVYARAVEIAAETAKTCRVDLPSLEGDHLGPLASQAQFDKVQHMIAAGILEGARLVAGGPGRPAGLIRGYFVRPTVFADVTNDMRIAREEIFGPVLAMIPFDDEDDAIAIANDTPYGLAAYVQSGDRERALRVARRLRAGTLRVNGAGRAVGSPFGGYKQSGNGREGGKWGLAEFLEAKTLSS